MSLSTNHSACLCDYGGTLCRVCGGGVKLSALLQHSGARREQEGSVGAGCGERATCVVVLSASAGNNNRYGCFHTRTGRQALGIRELKQTVWRNCAV